MRKDVRLLLTFALVSCAAFAQDAAQPAGKTTAKPAGKIVATKPAAKPATVAAPEAPKPAADALPSKETVEAFYKRMFGFQENLQFQVVDIRPASSPGLAEVTTVVRTPQGQQLTKLYVTSDGKHAVNGDLIPFGSDPFAENRAVLKESFGPVRGADKPGVKIVEFADLQCPACKAAQPIVDRLLAEVPTAQLTFQSFPLEKVHPWARQAANYLDCLSRTSNEQATTFIEAVFTHQADITNENAAQKLSKYVELSKGDPEKVLACSQTPETKARVQKSIDMGNKLMLTGTPTLYVNGRPISNVGDMPFEILKSVVEFEANQPAQ